MEYVVPPSPRPSIEVAGTGARFPVRRIYCVGSNYAAHVREMGGDPERRPPFFFQKAADTLLANGERMPYPPRTRDLQHEVELVVALGRGGTAVAVDEALELVFGYAVGLDMTRRDLQREAKANGRPWEEAKSFDAAAPCGVIAPASEIGHPRSGAIWLEVDGERRQEGDLAAMVWGVAEIIATLSRSVSLAAGDLIFTGTPAGVGTVIRGDHVRGGVDGVGTVDIDIG
ncbi:fumarylacetoacetate hydrolase family protein [Haliangium ochraceum]|uniref:Fumarylacetoacetate (FAA) hydrolase n=1 Tax=Haliangium ochraceum (strain DSM 14365 / JCM 11303 / SMP-2) TaxID=502025 RepID=D0LMH2_HALO1|nr:fumarylacetoacetate hydrolase family protein [Haliangium ochraceum]ACY18659.1 fumarylacetoacetate (FAA) hydrolase [Haliangium ochraceum DSM 14365]